jgi:hypothetical protein
MGAMASPPSPGRTRQAGSIVAISLWYGAVLIAIGVATLALGEVAHWTALIPAIVGALVLLVALAGRRGLLGEGIVGGAVLALSVLALTGTLSALPLLPAALSGGEGVRNVAAIIARSAMAAASLLYLGAMAAMILRRFRGRPVRP